MISLTFIRLLTYFIFRSGSCTIAYDDLVAYAEETGLLCAASHPNVFLKMYLFLFVGDLMAIRDAGTALEILDIDGDGKIGLLDFIHFARRLKKIHQGVS